MDLFRPDNSMERGYKESAVPKVDMTDMFDKLLLEASDSHVSSELKFVKDCCCIV